MPPHETPQHLFDDSYEKILAPPRRGHDGGTVYALAGLALLMIMLLIATGTVPLYEWEV